MLLLFEVLVSEEEEEVEAVVVRPSSLLSILRFLIASTCPCAAALVHCSLAFVVSLFTP